MVSETESLQHVIELPSSQQNSKTLDNIKNDTESFRVEKKKLNNKIVYELPILFQKFTTGF